ncbi:MAG: hypothetical protein JOZ99_02445 [Actinobacteria bacterium]|nr:hypothetical protein [Actinomycetota bacterium]
MAPSATTIYTSGGTASTSDGEISVVVPPGALSTPCVFHFTAVSNNVPPNPPDRVVTSRVWDISAIDGAGNLITVFNKPVEIVFRYAAQPTDLIAYWDTQEWVYLDSAPQPGKQETVAVSPHLSLVAVFGLPRPPQPFVFPVAPVAVTTVVALLVGGATVVTRRSASRHRSSP